MTDLIRKYQIKFRELPLPVKTSIIYIICSMFQKGISFIAVPVYTRLVLPEQYGIFSIFQSWDSVICIFATFNMWNYLFNNGMLKYERKKDEFVSALIGLSMLLTFVLFSIYLIFNKWFYSISGMGLSVMLLMFLDFFFRPSYEYWCARQRFEYDIKSYMIAAIVISVLTPVVSIVLITFCNKTIPQFSGHALVFGKVICAASVYIAVFFILISKCRKLYNREIWKYALNFNLPLIPHFLSGVILQQSDRIMIGSMCGNDKAGIYSVAYSVAAVIQIVNAAVMDSIIPWMYKNMRDRKYDKIPLVGSVSILIIAVVNVFVALCAPEVISIMGPEEYRIAAYIIPPVAISNVFIFMFNLYANIEYFYEETRFVMAASCISAIVNIVLNYVFIKKFGFIAAGYTTVACYILYAFCHFLFMKIILGKYKVEVPVYNIRQLWGIAAGATVAAFSIIGLYRFAPVRLFIGILILVLLFINRKRIINIFKEIRTEKNQQSSER